MNTPTSTEAGFDLDLDNLEALALVAKAGHWTAVKHNWSNVGIYSAGRPVACLNIIDDATEENQEALEAEMDADAEFMVAACNALPALIALARRAVPDSAAQPDSTASASGEALPCPFCGGACDPEGWLGTGIGGTSVRGPECEQCGATTDTIEDWNRRASLAPVSAQQGAAEKDGCKLCLGSKGGVPGNENVVGGVVVCDYCTSILMDMKSAGWFGAAKAPAAQAVIEKGQGDE
jgi:hypothetical protein